MELVECKKEYWDFVLDLRNKLKGDFIQQHEIAENEHKKFMVKSHNNYFVCLEGEVPVGFVGDTGDDIRIAVSPEHQNKGIGKFMLTSLVNNQNSSVAKIKVTNEASLRLFQSCGFKKKYYILER
jgi:ribosomal protein S18 acetylase RimI-like enzyme